MILALRSFGQFFRDAMMGPHPALARLATLRWPWRRKPAAKAAPCPAFDFIRHVNHGYINAIPDRWCEFGKVGRALRFTPDGMARLGSIFGYIEALSYSHPELAKAMATDLIGRLDCLSQYGGWYDEPTRTPAYIIQLSDDGTLHGFGVLWYYAFEVPDSSRTSDERSKALEKAYSAPGEPQKLLMFPAWISPGSKLTRCYSVAYKFSFNGGFLYSGPGCDEVFAVDLGSLTAGHTTFWSTHT